MSNFIQRRRLIKQLGKQSDAVNANSSMQLPQQMDDEDQLKWHMFSFEDSELTQFLSMNEYGNMEIGLDEGAIIKQVDELRLRFNKEYSSSFFNDSRDQLIGTIANRFMLGGIVSQGDRDGGNVDTIHNVRQKDSEGNLVYASDSFKNKYEQRGEYNSSEYHGDSRYIATNREYSAKLREGELEDSYTGKKFDKNGSYDLDHTISAKEIHDDAGRLLAGVDGPSLANREANLNPTHASINRSKKADSADQFAMQLQQQSTERTARIQELKAKDALNDRESGELRKLEQHEAVDYEKLKQLDDASRQQYEVIISKQYYLSKEFIGNVGISSVNEGARMGFQQVIGVFLTETITSVFNEIRDAVKQGKAKAKGFWSDIKERLIRIVNRVSAKWKEALGEGTTGFFSGVCSNIVTVIINAFVTTAKNLVRLIREGFFSIVKAVKMLLNPPAGMTKSEAFHEAGKIIISAVVLSLGIIIEEAVDKFPPMKMIRSIPIIGDLLYSVVFGFMTALVTALALWGWDKLDLFGVKEKARHQFVMDMLGQDRQRMLIERERWLASIKETDLQRYLFLKDELQLV